MGNCQAIDNASLVIQHPGGRAERLYWPITANEVMKLNPGHYVALLLTTTLYSNSAAATTAGAGTKQDNKIAPTNTNNQPLRVTRIKLLRPSDILSLGHAYRLITTQEVLKGLWEKKHGKTRKKIQSESGGKPEHEMRGIRGSSDFEKASTRSDQLDKTNRVKIKHEKQQWPRTSSASSSSSRGWHPSLNSISEASS